MRFLGGPRAFLTGLMFVAIGACGECGTEAPVQQPAAQAAAVEQKKDELPPATDAAALAKVLAKEGKSCELCRRRWCSGVGMGPLDLVSGCLKSPDPKLVTKPDSTFIADCKAVVECAMKNSCGYDPNRGPVQCYCGSKFVDECLTEGPAADAPCVKEWQAATRSKDNKEILLRFDQIDYPAGWAFHLMECDRERCGATTNWGTCTPTPPKP